jgi:hypothetical protein
VPNIPVTAYLGDHMACLRVLIREADPFHDPRHIGLPGSQPITTVRAASHGREPGPDRVGVRLRGGEAAPPLPAANPARPLATATAPAPVAMASRTPVPLGKST